MLPRKVMTFRNSLFFKFAEKSLKVVAVIELDDEDGKLTFLCNSKKKISVEAFKEIGRLIQKWSTLVI